MNGIWTICWYSFFLIDNHFLKICNTYISYIVQYKLNYFLRSFLNQLLISSYEIYEY